MSSLLQGILEFILEIFLRLILYFILLPISALLATPFILICAAFTKRPYWDSVKDGYYSVYDFWSRVLCWF